MLGNDGYNEGGGKSFRIIGELVFKQRQYKALTSKWVL